MESCDLGLPLEYNKLAKYFDLLNPNDDSVKNTAVERILSKHKAKTVLDLTCGTGSQVLACEKWL